MNAVADRLAGLPSHFLIGPLVNSKTASSRFRLLAVFCSCLSFVGCSPENQRKAALDDGAITLPVVLDPQTRSKEPGKQSADSHSAAVWQRLRAKLIAEPDNPQLHLAASKVAHELGEHQEAISLSRVAVSLTQEEELVSIAAQQAYDHNFYFDAVQFLESLRETGVATPVQSRAVAELHRDLGLEEQFFGLSRELIKERNFDSTLLAGCVVPEESRLPADAVMLETVERFPHDLRPLIGEARFKFGEDHFAECKQILDRVLGKHPENVEALITQGQLYRSTGERRKLLEWIQLMGGKLDDRWQYWSILGYWSDLREDWTMAARCYYQAHVLSPDRVDPILGLKRSLTRSSDEGLVDNQMQLIDECGGLYQLLTQLRNRRNEFVHENQSNSQRLAITIAEILESIGRLWEAEAWAAIALGINSDVVDNAAAVRARIVSKLTSKTPWRESPFRCLASLDWAPPTAQELTVLNISIDESAPSVFQASKPRPLSLRNEAKDRGLDFFGYPNEDLDIAGAALHQTLGCGVAISDYDLDGLPDVHLAAGGGAPFNDDSDEGALFRNQGGSFTQVTDQASVGDPGYTAGLAVGDLNADGFPDLYTCNIGQNQLFLNNGDGTFSNATSKAKLGVVKEWSTSAAFADFDGDGITDLFVLNYCAGREFLDQECRAAGIAHHLPCLPTAFPASPDRVYEQSRTGKLTDRVAEWRLKPRSPGRGLGIVVGALDHNPGLDILVANDMTENHLWSAQLGSSFGFSENAVVYGLAHDRKSRTQASMGIGVYDFDNDERVDFYITNYQNESNILLSQRERDLWSDKTSSSGTAAETLSLVGFGCQATDLDANGSAEIAFTNGHVDKIEKDTEYAQPFCVFHANYQIDSMYQGVFSFQQSDSFGTYGESKHIGRALAVLDADDDGREDILISHQSEPVALLMNKTQSDYHWFSLQLAGVQSARDAVGAIVRLTLESGSVAHLVVSGDGYMCSNQRDRRWGVGKHEIVDTVTVKWPSGLEQEFLDVPVDTKWMLVEAQELFPLDQ